MAAFPVGFTACWGVLWQLSLWGLHLVGWAVLWQLSLLDLQLVVLCYGSFPCWAYSLLGCVMAAFPVGLTACWVGCVMAAFPVGLTACWVGCVMAAFPVGLTACRLRVGVSQAE